MVNKPKHDQYHIAIKVIRKPAGVMNEIIKKEMKTSKPKSFWEEIKSMFSNEDDMDQETAPDKKQLNKYEKMIKDMDDKEDNKSKEME